MEVLRVLQPGVGVIIRRRWRRLVLLIDRASRLILARLMDLMTEPERQGFQQVQGLPYRRVAQAALGIRQTAILLSSLLY